MSSDLDPRFTPGDEPDDHFEDDEAPRSIFSATWFRVVIVVLAVGVIGAISVPYVLDVVNAPTPQTAATSEPATTPPATAPSTPSSSDATTTPPAATASPPTATQSAPPSEGGASAPSAPPAPVARATEPPKAAEPPKSSEKPKAPDKAPAAATPKATPAPAAATAKKESPAKAAAPARAKRSEGGDYFVQVGAFQDQATAQRLASRLRDQNYPVDESMARGGGAPSAAPRSTPRVAAATGPDRYDVIVSGGTASEINSKLSAKGLASEPAGEGVRIRPSLSLRDAVALSKDLGSEGFKVQVRRGGGGAPVSAAAEPAPSAAVGDGPTLYRVRVGPYPDRAAAVTVHREFQDKGYQPFIAKGRE